jgi:Domain of unknown function (DUF4383)
VSRSSPAQLYCTLAGALLVIAGLIGFFYSSGFDTGANGVARDSDEVLGIFAVNGWSNVLAIVLGLLGLALASSAARSYALGVGLLFLVFAIWGFIDGDDVTLGLFAANDADNVLDLILGLTGLAAGAASPAPVKQARRERPQRKRPSRPRKSQAPGDSKPAAKKKPAPAD